ncbi:MAG: beta-ketoacyl synthase N-terminal-like domain-containing protein [Nitrospirota bacterium]
MYDKVIISGAGLVSSLGLTASETWDALLAGRSGFREIEGSDTRGFGCRAAAQVQGLGPSELGIHPRDFRIMDMHSYMLMKSSRDAFKQSRLDSGDISPEDIGYFAGMGMVDYKVEDLLPAVVQSMDENGRFDYDKFFSNAYQQIHPLWPLSMLNNINFCQVAIDLGIKGDNTTFCPHSDSGIHSIIEAYNSVLAGKSKAVLAGGVSEKVSPMSIARGSWFGILNNSQEIGCSPLGSLRTGTLLGEGCGIVSLELQPAAMRRGVKVLAAVTGYAVSFEINENAHCPTSNAVSLSMKQAMAMANLGASDVDLIIAHGDGTNMGDGHEIEAIHNTFSECIDKVNVYCSKGALGHMLAGAGAADVVLGIYMLQHGIIPAVYSSSPQDESIKFRLVSGKPVKTNLRRILINSRSYEGQCASLIIEAVRQ